MSKEEFVNACLAYQQAKKDARETEYAAYASEKSRIYRAKNARKYYQQRGSSRLRRNYE